MKPRNPMGIYAHKRKAGVHRKTDKAVRRQEKIALYRDVAQGQSTRLLTGGREFDPLHPDQQQTHGDWPGSQSRARWFQSHLSRQPFVV